jgi:hypothetical protein
MITARTAPRATLILLAIGLSCGCDDQATEDCNEAGACPGVQPDAAVHDDACDIDLYLNEDFPIVFITDTTAAEDENTNGTPGVDICSVQSTCGVPIGATLTMGGGDLCQTDGPDCWAGRTNADASLSFEIECEAGSNPSHYVALGMGGELIVEFDAGQAGCAITIVEYEGTDVETYSVQICDDSNAERCIVGENSSTFLLREGTGTQTVHVPAINGLVETGL